MGDVQDKARPLQRISSNQIHSLLSGSGRVNCTVLTQQVGVERVINCMGLTRQVGVERVNCIWGSPDKWEFKGLIAWGSPDLGDNTAEEVRPLVGTRTHQQSAIGAPLDG